MRCSPKRQQGLALLFALLIVVIATTISVSLSFDGKYLIRKTSHIQLQDRASLYALGLEDWARVILKRDRDDSEIDHLAEDWATVIPGLPIEGGLLSGYLEDEQGKFNINSLVGDELAVKRFERLCDNLGIEPVFLAALQDWIDGDNEVRFPGGIEELYNDYRVANRPLADISELLLIKDVTQEIYELLEPHVTALPADVRMNLNTMSETVFASLDETADADLFLEERDRDAFESVEGFIERMQLPVEAMGLSVETNYFRAHGTVVQGNQTYQMTTLIQRQDSGETRVINRSLGQF